MQRGMALGKSKTFTGGLLFKADKQQADPLPLSILPAPPLVTIPLLQHSGGTPARPLVKPGDFVSMGQMIGETMDDTSAAVHASVSGTVVNVARYPFSEHSDTFAVSIENNGNDEFASPIPYDKPWQDSTPQELIAKISLSGIIDFNNTAVPAHIKLAAGRDSSAGSLILNAMVTEPYADTDYRLLLEQTEKVLVGGLICKKITGAERLFIAFNEKNSVIEKVLATHMTDERFKAITPIRLKPKYPQHEEKLLARACSPAIAAEKRTLVMNAASASYIRDAVMESTPWYQRIVTVAGRPDGSKKSFLVRIGTPVASLLEAGEIDLTRTTEIIAGGPLSGTAVSTLDTPVTKSANAILALASPLPDSGSFACINCGRCVRVCPTRLSPARLARLAQKNETTEMLAWHINECIDCGCCAYVCPSAINLLHFIQYGKRQIAFPLRTRAIR
jgi:Na+-translocating ferredoxin:NAD+ oxidoreductase subunit C